VDKRLRKALKALMDPDLESRRRAMESFVRATFEKFIRCLYRHLGNETECEDVLETVYADIWEKPQRLQNVTNDKELLRTVYMYYMRRRLREVYRRINRNLHLSQEGLSMLVAPQVDVLEEMAQEELLQVLRRMLGKLKARERRAVELWMEGMSIRAIANELRTTPGAVKMLKYRTMLKLKKEFNDYYK
jgi:RNA polymerase sigma factor (sigma-70 family)